MKKLLLASLCAIVLSTVYAQTSDSDTLFIQPQDTLQKENMLEQPVDNIPTLSLDDNDFATAGSNQNVSSLLTAGRDAFFNAAAFNFSAARFRVRGYDASNSAVYINGMAMDNLDNGYTPWALWSGLNDVFRNRDVNFGTRYNTFAFGDIGSTTNFDVRASKQRKQTSFGYALSNRTYTHRFTFTHSTGLTKAGWAFTLAGSTRYAAEGYVPGTFYRAFSFFTAIDKKIGDKQVFSLITFYAPTQNGRQAAATGEMLALAGSHYYNPSWGYQDGKKRSANIATTHQPVLLLNHEYRISNKSHLTSTLLYSFGEHTVSGLDWYNAADPRPDYYRYMPSYYENDGNAMMAEQLTNSMSNDEQARQINWENLYSVNRSSVTTITNANGISGNTSTGNRSLYILGDRVVHSNRFGGNILLNTSLAKVINYTGGIGFNSVTNHNFQRVNDLLGGGFWLNVNQFAQRAFPEDKMAFQNDIDHPNKLILAGEKYGYDYAIHIMRPAAWSQAVFKFKQWDVYISAELSQTSFYRKGNVRNGLFSNNSYGKSVTQTFTNYAVKGGITYKLDGRNYMYISGASYTKAPYYDDVYTSPRTRDAVQNNIQSETINTVEGGYILNAPRIKLRASGYYTTMNHGMDVKTFYYDEYQDFVNYALSNIGKLYFGSELSAEMKVSQNLTVSTVAALGRYYYNSRQHAVVTVDNTAETIAETTVYAKNYRIAGTPAEAYNTSITYRSPKFWFVSISGNYLKQMWLDINPLRRTYLATDGVNNPDDEKGHSILDQTELPAQYTIDFYGGYSWRIKHAYVGVKKHPLYLSFSAGINNITNNTNIISGGYEQLRYDFSASPQSNLKKFPPKFYYAYGLNYFLNFQFHF